MPGVSHGGNKMGVPVFLNTHDENARHYFCEGITMPGYQDATTLLNGIYSSVTDFAIFTIDNEGLVTTWNVGAERVLGYSEHEVIGQHAALFFTPEDRASGQPAIEIDTASRCGRAADYRWHQRKDGSRFWADGVLTTLHNEKGKADGYLKILKDITDRKLAEEKMEQMATVDYLTGLANRSSFDARLVEMMSIVSRSQQIMILHLLDLDYFKQVNDTLGHHGGDMLLKMVAERMRHATRDGDLLARLGGDEFAIVQMNLPTPEAGGYLAEKLLSALAQPFHIEGHEVLISGSMGLALCPTDASTPDELQKKADLALYRAKNLGRNCFHYFTDQLDAVAHKKSLDLVELRLAVEHHQFWLEYQPKVALNSGQTLGLEALLRCSNPRLASYPVDDLVTLAAEAGLMQKIGLWVIREACSQLRNWKNIGLTDLKVCVNVCSRELSNPKAAKDVLHILAVCGLQPEDLEIEITERQAMDVEKSGINTLLEMRSQGIQIALDDFGTGYSALSYLNNLPVTSLKLDKSFLHGVPEDGQRSAVARLIIELARTLHLEVVAEGVESESQMEFFRREQCTAIQGFFFSKPLPQDEITEWLLKNSARHPMLDGSAGRSAADAGNHLNHH
jgi:diguanylate cyclase (GGDEF)-like protein/PAS domain S-box-containing protein